MSRSSIQINDFVSLAVMLLMVVALIGGQSNANVHAAERGAAFESVEHVNVRLGGHVGSEAIKVSIAVVSELSKLRSELETDK